jgi:hypothetical protein
VDMLILCTATFRKNEEAMALAQELAGIEKAGEGARTVTSEGEGVEEEANKEALPPGGKEVVLSGGGTDSQAEREGERG